MGTRFAVVLGAIAGAALACSSSDDSSSQAVIHITRPGDDQGAAGSGGAPHAGSGSQKSPGGTTIGTGDGGSAGSGPVKGSGGHVAGAAGAKSGAAGAKSAGAPGSGGASMGAAGAPVGAGGSPPVETAGAPGAAGAAGADPAPTDTTPPPPPPPPECQGGDGLYCGQNGVNGDPNVLYRCTGGVVSVEQNCPGPCTIEPDGMADQCPAPPPPPGSDDAVNRALEWVNVGMPYCGGSNHGTDYICGGTCERDGADATGEWDPYRTDCSGLVSYAWQLPPPGRVTGGFAPFNGDVSHEIDAGQLAAGDALNNSTHVFLFAGWVDQGAGLARVIEEYNCGHVATDHDITLQLNGGSSVYSTWHSDTFTSISKN